MRDRTDIDLVRSRIRSGRLPRSTEGRTFGGQGAGQSCACCDEPIGPSEVQFAVEPPAGAAPRSPLVMHLRCFQLWLDECHAYLAERLGLILRERRTRTMSSPFSN